MKTIVYHFVDKSGWPKGEWQDEPDKLQWLDLSTNLPCLIIRGPMGALCGYVGISEGHPYYKKDWGDDETIESSLSVHGGVTFTGGCNGEEENGICHKVEKGENDKVWWIGFDCAHAFDYTPSGFIHFEEDTYRNLAYVKSEVESLALQLKEVT